MREIKLPGQIINARVLRAALVRRRVSRFVPALKRTQQHLFRMKAECLLFSYILLALPPPDLQYIEAEGFFIWELLILSAASTSEERFRRREAARTSDEDLLAARTEILSPLPGKEKTRSFSKRDHFHLMDLSGKRTYALSTAPERRQRVQTCIVLGVPSTTTLTLRTFGCCCVNARRETCERVMLIFLPK